MKKESTSGWARTHAAVKLWIQVQHFGLRGWLLRQLQGIDLLRRALRVCTRFTLRWLEQGFLGFRAFPKAGPCGWDESGLDAPSRHCGRLSQRSLYHRAMPARLDQLCSQRRGPQLPGFDRECFEKIHHWSPALKQTDSASFRMDCILFWSCFGYVNWSPQEMIYAGLDR